MWKLNIKIELPRDWRRSLIRLAWLLCLIGTFISVGEAWTIIGVVLTLATSTIYGLSNSWWRDEEGTEE